MVVELLHRLNSRTRALAPFSTCSTPGKWITSACICLTADSPLGGVGIADVIFGNYNPGGRMPITIYNPDVTIQPMTDYNMTQAPGFTYR